MTFKEYVAKLEIKIVNSYEQGVSLEDAEKLAGEFLVAQLRVSSELSTKDLDSRMRKVGIKGIRAAAYTNIKSNTEVKHTEASIAALIDQDKDVKKEQTAFDLAEVERDELERMYNVFGNAHIHFRSIAKGSM